MSMVNETSLSDAFERKFAVKYENKLCIQCLTKCVTSSKLSFINIPKVLVFCLQRHFQPLHKMSKIVVPLTLNIDQKTYDLKSAIIHNGDFNSGHFYTIAKHGHCYYEFNDTQVKELSEEVMQQTMNGAYIAVYELTEEVNALGNLYLIYNI